MAKKLNLKGKRFGRLLVLEEVENTTDNISRRSRWLCKCDCGNEIIMSANCIQVKNGVDRSCGCATFDTRRKPFGESALSWLYHSYILNAKNRDIEFNLSKEEFRTLVDSNCFYCNRKPSQIYRQKRLNGGYTYNGIDRVDNSRGYELDNCVPCCKYCNRAKDTMTKEEFYFWISSVYFNSAQVRK